MSESDLRKQQKVVVTGAVSIIPEPLPVLASVVEVPSSDVPVLLSAQNLGRKELIIVNDGAYDLFVKYNSIPSLTNWSFKLKSGDTTVIKGIAVAVYGVWEEINGKALITEI
jgi:hypothetical protein